MHIIIDFFITSMYNNDKTHRILVFGSHTMKKYLIPAAGTFYKANLHCHSTVSDGSLTPQEIKDEYLSRGYSVVAYTDHEIMINHHDLTDDSFLALSGYEMSIETDDIEWGHPGHRVCHICFIAMNPSVTHQVCWDEKIRSWFNDPEIREQIKYTGDPQYKRVYSGEGISEVMQTGRANGFFVTYNHPNWSQEFAEQYLGYHGMHAMEICNYGCITEGYDDYNPRAYDEILQGGERIFCIATDDNHNHHPKNSRRWDSGGGFTMIKAEKLEYESITQALLDGHFYASQGPLIDELWYEDGAVHIKCSPADKIQITYGFRHNDIVWDESGEGITHAKFAIDNADSYFRITVTDKYGKHADTNAYYIKDIMK